jgi:hypothetical protein
MAEFVGGWLTLANMVPILPDLVDILPTWQAPTPPPFGKFGCWASFCNCTLPRGGLSLVHVTTLHDQPCHLFHVTYQVVVQSSTWLYGLPCGTFPLVHEFDRKSPKMSDTWQPLVLPCHHDTCLLMRVPRTLYG